MGLRPRRPRPRLLRQRSRRPERQLHRPWQDHRRRSQWFANESESEELKAVFQKAGSEALEQVASNKNASRYANDIAIVTGVSPNSIAAQVVEGLLAGGATVVATSHSFKPSIKAWAKQAYREHATGNAKLWLVPANLSSYRDSTHWSTGWATSRRRPPVLPPRF